MKELLTIQYFHVLDIHLRPPNHSHILIQNDDWMEREVWHNIIQSEVVSIPEAFNLLWAPLPTSHLIIILNVVKDTLKLLMRKHYPWFRRKQ